MRYRNRIAMTILHQIGESGVTRYRTRAGGCLDTLRTVDGWNREMILK